MIKISIDEAAAFDMLSIHMTKLIDTGNSDIFKNTLELLKEIREAIGEEKLSTIIFSEEYHELNIANIKIFKKIDKIKIDEKLGDAGEIDRLNHTRFTAKKKIQEKYFNKSLTEKKFGYK